MTRRGSVNGVTYAAARHIEVSAVAVGQQVHINTYRDSNDVVRHIGSAAHQTFLPLIHRHLS